MKLSISINLLLILISWCTGCSTASPILPYKNAESHFSTPPELIENEYSDTDIYRIYHRAATGFVSINSIRQSAESRAEEFAKRQDKTITILGEKTSNPPYILGNFPRIEIVFALIDDEKSSTEKLKSKYDDLEKLKKLLDNGVITEEEFTKEKYKILNN
jgi:intein/homing endonuclease